MAALNGHKDVVQLLLELNADINAAKTVQTTDMLTHCRTGADPCSPARWLWLWQDGITGLFMAALNGHKDVVQQLLELNADINAAKTVQTTDMLTLFHLIQ